MLVMTLWASGLPPGLANTTAEKETSAKQLLSEVLEELSETYEVFFSYETKVLKDVEVDFEFIPGESLNQAINRLLAKTNLLYESLNAKYVIIYKDDNASKKTAKKLRKKINQINKLEQKRNISLQPKQKTPDAKFRTIAHTAAQLNQNVVVSGTVTDAADGSPLPGVSIYVKGASTGTVTDIDGRYQLSVPDDAAVLVFSFTGYAPKEVEIGTQSVIDVALDFEAEQLGEVVVTALGIEKNQRTLGYATSNVDPDELTVNRQPKFMDALQGKVAGVNITSLGSGPQGSSKIRIRGVSSFGKNNSPLIVVNGVPIDNSNRGVYRENGENGNGTLGPKLENRYRRRAPAVSIRTISFQ